MKIERRSNSKSKFKIRKNQSPGEFLKSISMESLGQRKFKMQTRKGHLKKQLGE